MEVDEVALDSEPSCGHKRGKAEAMWEEEGKGERSTPPPLSALDKATLACAVSVTGGDRR
jgi:hypothetical protein